MFFKLNLFLGEKMKKLINLLLLIIVLSISPLTIARTNYYIDDGQTHTVENDIYYDNNLYLDYNAALSPGSNIDLIRGNIGALYMWNNSTATISGGRVIGTVKTSDNASANISGGRIGYHLDTYDDSNVIVSGGFVQRITANNSSNVTISGGWIDFNVLTYDHSSVNMSGGTIMNNLAVYDNSEFNLSGGKITSSIITNKYCTVSMSGGLVGRTLYATNGATVNLSGGTVEGELFVGNGTMYLSGGFFTVIDLNGELELLSPGDKVSDYASYVEFNEAEEIPAHYAGTLHGMLADGSSLSNEFRIFETDIFDGTADIIVVPEPASLLLLGIGGVFLRKRGL